MWILFKRDITKTLPPEQRPCIVDNRYKSIVMPKRTLDPLPSAAFHILLALAEEPLHGYAIMRAVAEETEGRMRLGPGTLYGSIRTLLREKLIEEIDKEGEGSERRRYYKLTPTGRKLARAEAERLAELLRVARSKKVFRGDYV